MIRIRGTKGDRTVLVERPTRLEAARAAWRMLELGWLVNLESV
jgi:hypothetical protein